MYKSSVVSVCLSVGMYMSVTGSLAVRPQPGHTPHLLPTFAIYVRRLVLSWPSCDSQQPGDLHGHLSAGLRLVAEVQLGIYLEEI